MVIVLTLKNIRIQWKLFGFFVTFIAVLLVILWLMQTVFLASIYKTIKTNNIRILATKIEAQVNEKDINNILNDYANENDLHIIIFASDGKQAYLEKDNSILPEKIPPQEIQKLIKLNESNPDKSSFLDFSPKDNDKEKIDFNPNNFSRDFHINNFRGDNLIYSKNIADSSGNQYLLLITAVIAPVNTTVETIRIELIYITVIMLILALAFAIIFSKKISKPIEQINTSAKILAEGNYNTRFSGNGYREISELSDTLNYTAKELSKVESLRRELIANVSHDLRTPLTMITGYSEVLRDIPGENTPENIQVIIDEANRLTNLVNDMLDLSKLQEGELTLNVESFNFTESIRNILERYNKMHDAEGYQFILQSSEDIEIVADKNKIYQVVYNLVNNAITYCGTDKTVTIRQKLLDNNRLRLEVSDTGDGIAEEDMKYIWDRYFKVDKAHKRAHIGTGLGLSIVKKVITMHKGTCGVESQIGKGSTFWFELPIK